MEKLTLKNLIGNASFDVNIDGERIEILPSMRNRQSVELLKKMNLWEIPLKKFSSGPHWSESYYSDDREEFFWWESRLPSGKLYNFAGRNVPALYI